MTKTIYVYIFGYIRRGNVLRRKKGREITKFINDSLEHSLKLLEESGSYPKAYVYLESAFDTLRTNVNAKTTTIVFAGKKYKFTFGRVDNEL